MLDKTKKITFSIAISTISIFFLSNRAWAADPIVIESKYTSIISADSQNYSYPATYAVDGNISTFWHTRYSPTIDPQPHNIVIDIKAASPVVGIQYLPRQDGGSSGYIKNYEIYVSNDLTSWGDAVATGTFDIYKGDKTQKEVLFTEKTGRYIKFVSLSEISGRPYSAAAEIRILATSYTPPPAIISYKYTSIISADSQNYSYPATYAVDGNISTFWHTRYSPTIDPQPHNIVIDIKAASPVVGIQYLPRQDGGSSGYIKNYEIYVSNDLTSWGDAVATGTFDIYKGDKTQKEVLFTEKTGRYIKFVSLSEISGRPYSAAAEIRILATSYTPPPTIGPEISVGLWKMSRSESQSTPFRIRANKQYNIRNSSGTVIAKISGGTNTYVSYDGNDILNVSGSVLKKIVGSYVTFDAADSDNSNMIFDVNTPVSGLDQYRGKFRFKFTKYDDDGDGTVEDSERQIWGINILPMEQYVWGMGEITGTGAMEYNKVMTTSFRTYGYYKLYHSTAYTKRGFIVNASPGNQLYYGYEWEVGHPRIKEGAQATRGKIVTHPQSIFKSDVAITPYSSWTDGKTRSFEERWGSKNYPWCQSVSDPYGKHPTMSTSELVAAGNHMVGLSAHGALELATNHGWDWQRILKYYYTGIAIKSMY